MKMAEVYDDSKNVVRGAGAVRAEAQKKGDRIHRAGRAYPAVVREMMRELTGTEGGDERERGQGLAAACTFENFLAALQKCEKGKGVGADGWNAYLLRRAPVAVQRAYYDALCIMIRTSVYDTRPVIRW